PAPSFVGFRCTQPNLPFAGVIAKGETQQRPISKPSPKSFNTESFWLFSAHAVSSTQRLNGPIKAMNKNIKFLLTKPNCTR
ncbi:MAG: hypothetical protein V2J65_33020, partial [Desulfobacteraceae bacterium]|nr:hypothetical protein [Desulfobacteraceae bacterium]